VTIIQLVVLVAVFIGIARKWKSKNLKRRFDYVEACYDSTVRATIG